MRTTPINSPDPLILFWQGAKPWGPMPYGFGGKTIAQWGCTASGLAFARRQAGLDATSTPGTIVADAMKLKGNRSVWSPGSSLAALPAMARSAGFDVAADWGDDAVAIDAGVIEAIDAGGFGWLHVDYTGDDKGEHWIMAFAHSDKVFCCADSATKKVQWLSRGALRGLASWAGVEKKYRACRGYALLPA